MSNSHGQPARKRAETTAPASAASAEGGPSPDDVLRLLETCQLSEQDTEELLKDAYALNRLLRAHLAHVEAPAVAGGNGSTAGSAGSFGRQLSGPERHEQSASRRSVSLNGRPKVGASLQPQQQQHAERLPPIRARSPGQRLSEMARVYNSGVIQSRHRSGASGGADSAATSSKKRL